MTALFPFRANVGVAKSLAGRFEFIYLELVAVCLSAFVFYILGYAELLNAFIFSIALLGLFHPARLLELFIFCLAFDHRDFAYIDINVHGASIYVTEWVLLMLLLAAVPKLPRIIREYRLPFIALGAYIAIGIVFFVASLGSWPFYYTIRDFALVYYSLFCVAALAHVDGIAGVRRLGFALMAGTLPNLAAETFNWLYGTLPLTLDQKNYSMRNSYFYAAALGFVLPYLHKDGGGKNRRAFMYALWLALVILLYSYSKTPMFSLLITAGMYVTWRRHELTRKDLLGLLALLAVPLLFTPEMKTFHFISLLNPMTYFHNNRTLLHLSAVRDFAEYPYGIGFGAPVIGSHAYDFFVQPEGYVALHNSYLAIFRRMGLFGGAAFMILCVSALYFTFKALATPEKPDHRVMWGVAAAWIATAVFCGAHVVLEGPFFGTAFWILLGCVYVSASHLCNNATVQNG